MAKSRKQKSVEAPNTKAAILKLLKKYKEPENIQWIRTGIHALDLILGGGFPMKRIIELFGSESSGKSTLGWLLAKKFQEAGGVVIFLDMESTEPVENARNLGVNVDEIFRPDPMPETVEQVRDSVRDIVNDIRAVAPNVPILVLWDTVAATGTFRQWEKGEKGYNSRQALDATMGAVAAALSQYFQEFSKWLYNNNVTMLCINQVREKIGVMFGNPETTPGGRALKFYSSIRLRLNKGKKLTVENNVIGFTCHASVEKNKFTPAFRKAELKFQFAKGKSFDPYIWLVETLEAAGRIIKTKEGKLFPVDKPDEIYNDIETMVFNRKELLEDWIN